MADPVDPCIHFTCSLRTSQVVALRKKVPVKERSKLMQALLDGFLDGKYKPIYRKVEETKF